MRAEVARVGSQRIRYQSFQTLEDEVHNERSAVKGLIAFCKIRIDLDTERNPKLGQAGGYVTVGGALRHAQSESRAWPAERNLEVHYDAAEASLRDTP